jgi:hypothetical protein
MPREESQKALERLQKQLQDSILNEYPNPERKGCPGDSVLKRLAAHPLDEPIAGDLNWHHVTHCSECYREFLVFRDEFKREIKHRRTKAARVLVAAVIIVIAIVAFLFFSRPTTPRVPPSVAERPPAPSKDGSKERAKTLTAVLNMEGASPTRGAEGKPEPKVGNLQRLPRVHIAPLLVYLPFGTEPGAYEVQLSHDEDNAAPLATFAGNAEVRDGLTILRVSPDLSDFPPGTYVLAVLHDQVQLWSCRFRLA